jgi:hypothetical protein
MYKRNKRKTSLRRSQEVTYQYLEHPALYNLSESAECKFIRQASPDSSCDWSFCDTYMGGTS